MIAFKTHEVVITHGKVHVYVDNPWPLSVYLDIKLHSELLPVHTNMDASYTTLATQLTELKMEHKNGELKSDRLAELLAYIYRYSSYNPCYPLDQMYINKFS